MQRTLSICDPQKEFRPQRNPRFSVRSLMGKDCISMEQGLRCISSSQKLIEEGNLCGCKHGGSLEAPRGLEVRQMSSVG